jgi:uncharacterized protein (DUF362 family)
MKNYSRRDFLRLMATSAGALAGSRLLSACNQDTINSTPTSSTPASILVETPSATPDAIMMATQTKTPTLIPFDTLVATSTSSPQTITPVPELKKQLDLIQIYPAVPSRVVRCQSENVWQNDKLESSVLNQMLDALIIQMTGITPAKNAWRALFDPNERIAIKVNTILGSMTGTHVPLVLAVANRLQASGIPAEQIVIYDRNTYELQIAGYTLNDSKPGVQCIATNDRYNGDWNVVDVPVKLSQVLLDCDALINIPILKQHGMAGISFAMKNHYGTIDKPSHFHAGEYIQRGLAEVNKLPPIKDRTRLIIGDALQIVLGNSWTAVENKNTLIMSFDPVAHDTIGLDMFKAIIAAKGRSTKSYEELANPWLANGAQLGLGTNELSHIELLEVPIS